MTDARPESGCLDWPLFGLQLRFDEVLLRPVREQDFAYLAAIQADDYEHDPRAEAFPG